MILKGVGPGAPVLSTSLRQVPTLVNVDQIVVYFIDSQRGLLPPFLGFWPLELFQQFCNVTLIAPVPTCHASSSSLNVLNPINVCLVMWIVIVSHLNFSFKTLLSVDMGMVFIMKMKITFYEGIMI